MHKAATHPHPHPYEVTTAEEVRAILEQGLQPGAADSPPPAGILAPRPTSRDRRRAQHTSRPLITYAYDHDPSTSRTYRAPANSRSELIRAGRDIITSSDGREYYMHRDGSLRRVR